MINKSELQYSLDSIVVYILDDIIAPMIKEAPGLLKIDPHHTNLEEFFEEPLDSQVAIRNIIRKYQLPKFAQEYIDEDFSFAQLAIFILLNGIYNEDYRGVA